MTADDDGLEALLRARYLAELRKALEYFGGAMGLNQGDTLTRMDAVSRLFVRYDSFPAFSAWRTEVLRAELAGTRADLGPAEGKAPAQAEPRLRAVQILGGERMTTAEWTRAARWATAHGGRRLKGTDGKWNLTEEEMQEALR